MSILKCKMCGGDLEISEGVSVCECEFCGTKQTVPNADDEKKITLFGRANRLRFACEFDKAAGVYESIVADFPEEAEAYWGLVLCKYGIEYVDDPASGKKIPTCHRSSFDSVMDDANFEQALENADAVARSVYRDEAKQIEKLRKGIIEVSSKEEPYDIFICYKETDDKGDRTVDSVIAQDVYTELTEKGYRVFFSRISLEDKLGTEYEPYIFAALNSAKIMLAFGTDYEYYNAVWVKNEWSRFIQLIAKGEKKTLIPCYKDIDAYDMPKEFAKLQAQDMGKVGAIQDLLRGIEKILPKKTETTVQVVNQVSSTAAPGVESLLERAFMFLEDCEWDQADEYCDKVLDIDPKCAEAYLGKLMAHLRVETRKQLADCSKPFDEYAQYNKILRFGDDKIVSEIKGYIAHINDRNEKAICKKAFNNMRKATTEAEYLAIIEELKKIVGNKYADELVQKCLEKAETCRRQGETRKRENEENADAIAIAIKNKNSGNTLQEQLKQQRDSLSDLQKLSQSFESRIAEIESFRAECHAAVEQIQKLQAERSTLGLFAGKKKRELDEDIEKYSNIKKDNEQKEKNLVAALKGYKDKREIATKIEQIESDISKLESQLNQQTKALSYPQALQLYYGNKDLRECFNKKYPDMKDCIESFTFGHYWQSPNSAPTPIEWFILDAKNDKILLISKYALDCKPYNITWTNTTWEECTLRTWLNGTFYDAAFNAGEQKMIVQTKVTADKNPSYSTSPGNNTTDKVFLLSITEVEKYNLARCAPTDYAIAHGAIESDSIKNIKIDGRATCWWWLRSPGNHNRSAARVSDVGSVVHRGFNVNIDGDGVRPAIWISLGD